MTAAASTGGAIRTSEANEANGSGTASGDAGGHRSLLGGYPKPWEADVVLADGGVAHIRPIRPDDKELLNAFHNSLSEETVYYRFFSPYPRLSPRDLERFTQVDYEDRVALVALIGGEFVAVARYDRTPGTNDAEVAFTVQDGHQGRGFGSILLEHLAAAARERGIEHFYAETLPANRRMLGVFRDAGWQVSSEYEEGTVSLTFPIEQTDQSLDVMRAREHKAEARSIARLLTPESIAVVGASRDRNRLGYAVFRHLIDGRFTGPVYPVNALGGSVAAVRAYPTVEDVPDVVDLVVVATPAAAVQEVVDQCARKKVRGLVVVSGGFSESGPAGRAAELDLVRAARANGMRLLGPNCLGMINTDPDVSLNASLAPALPPRGGMGMFSQSGALGTTILELVARRGLGISVFVSAGNRADVSGNDLLQYFTEDDSTVVVLSVLESFGNPRKFARIARTLSHRKPVVVLPAGSSARAPWRAGGSVPVPEQALNAIFTQAGVLRADTLGELLDLGALLSLQPLPAGRSVAVIGNAVALGSIAADAIAAQGLQLAGGSPVDLGPAADDKDFADALGAALDDPAVDAVLTVFVPPLGRPDPAIAGELSRAGARSVKPVLSTFLGEEGVPRSMRHSDGAVSRGAVPSFASAEQAVAALAKAVLYAEWRARPPGELPAFPDIDERAAARVCASALAHRPGGRHLEPHETRALLGAAGIRMLPAIPVNSARAAVEAAHTLGGPVAVKASSPELQHRTDLGAVRLNLDGERAVRAAYLAMAGQFGRRERLVVQPMAPPGVACTVRIDDDPGVGAIVTFGLSGVATDLLGDRAYRAVPLTDLDAGDMIREVRAAPMLFGYRGSEPVDVTALEETVLRLATLADLLPELGRIELDPLLVTVDGCVVLDAEATVAAPAAGPDDGRRRMI